MSITVTALVLALVVWMLLCLWCGYRVRVAAFFAVVAAGLALNMAWMVFGLNARPFEPHALMAQFAAVLYAVATFGVGWLAGRLVRQFRMTRVD